MDVELFQATKEWITVERRTKSPLAPVVDLYAGKGRYDVGGHMRSVFSGEPSDVVYYGETPLVAMAEKLSYSRRWDLPPELLEMDQDDPLPEWLTRGAVPADFVDLHCATGAIIDAKYRFVRVASPRTLWYLNRISHLVDKARKNNYQAIDLGVLTGPHKEITQAISLFFYKQTDAAGKPLYDGIYYPSRLGQDWNCLAVYASRVAPKLSYIKALERNDATLRKALDYMNLDLEGMDQLQVVSSGKLAFR